MKSPQNNSEGYYKSSVHNTTGFSCVRGGVLLQHGTGDDNVHFQNSAVLVDLLMTGGVASVGTNSTTSTIALNFDQNIIDSKFDQDPGFHIHEEGVVVWERQQNSQDSTPSLDIQSASQKPVSPSKLTVQWFTDSDHGISFHGSTLFLRKQMARWLYREKRRKEQDIAAEIEEEELWLSKL